MGKKHIEAFLTHLVADKKIAGTTQSQVLNAIVFLYKQVLNTDLGDLAYLRNVRRFKNIPTVLGPLEVKNLLALMRGRTKIMAVLLYGQVFVSMNAPHFASRISTYTIALSQSEIPKVIRPE